MSSLSELLKSKAAMFSRSHLSFSMGAAWGEG